MDNENPLELEEKRRTGKGPIKKRYSKPAFRFERVFETQALSCGKIISSQGQCKTNRKNS